MRLSISAAGIASAQGSLTQSFNSTSLRKPATWPWPVNGWATSPVCRPAVGVDRTLRGIPRWQRLARLALVDCFGSEIPNADAATPIFIGSCNGAADGIDEADWRKSFDTTRMLEGTPWAGKCLPMFSSSCNSGLHALYAATKALEAGAKEAVVLAVDILSRINQSNFESLRVLSESPGTPWQQNSSGFILGEAAVALRITATSQTGMYPEFAGPELTNTINEVDGPRRVLRKLSPTRSAIILGQGTGSSTRDKHELAAFQTMIANSVPVSTPLLHFGHTLGASGLLSMALAVMAQREARFPLSLVMPATTTRDGRPLLSNADELRKDETILLTSGALDGSFAAAVIGRSREQENTQARTSAAEVWQQPKRPGPLMHPTLKQVAADATAQRPNLTRPPDLLVVRLDEPLTPPASAWFGERLLPSAVLEITPGFISQLIAQCWGFTGPALCMVGATDADANTWALIPSCESLGLRVARIDVKGTGENREIIWNV